MLSTLFPNDTLPIVSIEIAPECPGQTHLKAVKAVLSISQALTPAIAIPLCYNFITHLCCFGSTDHAATSSGSLASTALLSRNLSYNSK